MIRINTNKSDIWVTSSGHPENACSPDLPQLNSRACSADIPAPRRHWPEPALLLRPPPDVQSFDLWCVFASFDSLLRLPVSPSFARSEESVVLGKRVDF